MEYRAMICEGRGQYDKAIYWLDTLIEHNTKISELPVVVVFLRNKARVLSKIGKSEESWQIFDRAFQLNDSIHGKEFNAQLDELRTQYEVDKITAEKERNRNYFLFALGGCGLLAITLGIRIYYSRLVTKKNRTMVVQIKELQAEQQRRDEEMLRKTTFEMPETTYDFYPESRRDKLCLAIRDLLLKDKIYRNPTLNRDIMVEQLGTSKNLFIEAFQHCFNMPLADYINELRLNDAIALLEQSDLSIEELSEKAGFGSDRTFRRQFQDKYNMSPQNYRKLAKEKPFQ
jgi:AraC-like DNA-binding protein